MIDGWSGLLHSSLNVALGWEREKGEATDSSILAWRIPLTVYSPWGHKEWDTTERVHFTSTITTLNAP